ncbi:DUF4179 domain-containing protein [Paenibacillus sp. A3]|uniref:DUF4179 domain-containing protein n=1 Tax=Paenibacillus sp. A3 TaxID=1337054 RepID=UPI0009EAD4DC|nr:DUF4179 domain-containing protein [Paenibacillus sp. A3]
MKCLSRDEMEMFLTRSVVTDRSGIANHIATCSDCKHLKEDLVQEEEHWSREIYAETLPESFTDQVMSALQDEEIEPATPEPITERAGRVAVTRRRKIWWVTAGIASILVLLSVASFYSIPTVAEMIRSLYSRNYVDIGLLRAQEFGLVQHPNIKIKDKGYTLKIDEAVADPTRVIVALQLFGPDGKHERARLRLLEERNGNRIVVKDEQGKVIGKLEDIGFTNDFYYLVAFFAQPIQSNRITIEGQIGIIDGDPWDKGFPAIKGNWNFEFPIDMTEAQKQTKITKLQGEYTSPGGMTVRLKRLTRMVQGVRLELDTELSPEALMRSPGDLWQKQELMFHFDDAAGSEIHSVGRGSDFPSVMAKSQTPGDSRGLMHLSYTFKDLPEDQPYRFVFDGYSVAERDGSSVSFEPARLKEEAVFFRTDGDNIRLKGFTIKQPPDTDSKETEGVLHVDGKLWNEPSYDDWTVRNSEGKEYSASMTGHSIYGLSRLNGSDWTIELGGDNKFKIPGMLTVPERLTLIRNVVIKRYVNVDWSVEMNGSPGNRQ